MENSKSQSGQHIKVNLNEIFEAKQEIQEERHDVGPEALFRDMIKKLHEKYRNNKEYLTSDYYVKISNKKMHEDFDELMRGKERFGNRNLYKACLRECGFEAPTNRKKLRVPYGNEESSVRLCNIFDDRVIKKLDITPVQRPKEETLDSFQKATEESQHSQPSQQELEG